MTRGLTTLFATAAILGGLATASLALAEEGTPAQQEPSGKGMMGGHGGMPVNSDQMPQMSEMMSNCNRMMEGMNGAPTGPGSKGSSGHHG
jgi:hypothetical protein